MIELLIFSLLFSLLVSTLVLSKIYPVSIVSDIHHTLVRQREAATAQDKKELKKKYDGQKGEQDHEGVKFVIGESENGPVTVDMQSDPSLIIGGSPGSGKTNLFNNILLSAAAYTTNIHFFILSTHKGSIYRQYKKLLAHSVEVCFEPYRWKEILNQLEKEVDLREKKIDDASKASISIENIATYNRVHTNAKMPYLLLFIDEVQAILEGEEKKQRLAQLIKIIKLGRSSGIYVISGTQYVSKKQLSGELLGAVACGIALRTANEEGSKNLIGSRGAEDLNPNKGEGIIKSTDYCRVKFVNSHVDPKGVQRKIRKINKKNGFKI